MNLIEWAEKLFKGTYFHRKIIFELTFKCCFYAVSLISISHRQEIMPIMSANMLDK
jgi:hypothetical protein